MPAEPTVESFTETVFGTPIVATVWTVDDGDLFLSFLAADYGSPFDEDMANGAFDGAVGGMARSANGTIVSTEPLSIEGGIARRSVIEFDGGAFTLYTYAKGSWFVVITGSGPEADQPALQALVRSFSFA